MAVGLNASGDIVSRSSVAIGDVGMANLTLCGWVYFPTALQATEVIKLNGDAGRYILIEIHVPVATPELGGGDSQTGTQSFATQPSAGTWIFVAIVCSTVAGGDTQTFYWSPHGSSTFYSLSRSNGVENSLNTSSIQLRGSNTNGVRHAYFRAFSGTKTQGELETIKESSTAVGGEYLYWTLDNNTDTGDDSGNGRTATFSGTLTSETSPTLSGGATGHPASRRLGLCLPQSRIIGAEGVRVF